MRFRLAAANLLLLGLACGLGESTQVRLHPIDGGPVSGQVALRETFCKNPCVTSTFDLQGGGDLRGVARWGSCAAPGAQLGGDLSTDPTFAEPISMVSGLEDLSGKACIQVVRDTADGSRAVLACGDVP